MAVSVAIENVQIKDLIFLELSDMIVEGAVSRTN